MYGILGKPYFNFEPYIDVQPLVELHHEISFGLALLDPLRSDTGAFRWKGEPRVDVLTKMSELRAGGDPKHIQALDELFRQGGGFPHKAFLYTQLVAGGYTGSRILLLKYNKDYYSKNNEEGSKWSPNAKHFPGLMAYIKALPFAEIGQIIFFVTENDCVTPIHRDIPENSKHRPSEFMWFSPQSKKKFFLLNEKTEERYFPDCRVMMFNELDFHGVAASSELSYSIRIDGRFTDEFRERTGLRNSFV